MGETQKLDLTTTATPPCFVSKVFLVVQFLGLAFSSTVNPFCRNLLMHAYSAPCQVSVKKICVNFESRHGFQHILYLIVQRFCVLEAKNCWRSCFLIFLTTSLINSFRKSFQPLTRNSDTSLIFLPALASKSPSPNPSYC